MSHHVTAPAPLAAPTDLSDTVAANVVSALNTLLADSFALYIKTKNFHWHVSGPHFRDYHLMLDAQATQIIGTTDGIAERVRKIGGTTIRSIADIARRQTIADSDAPYMLARDMLEELRLDNMRLVGKLRYAKTCADDVGDNATSAITDVWTNLAEERAWFLFEATNV